MVNGFSIIAGGTGNSRRPQRVLETLEWVRAPLPAACWQELRDRALLRAGAPLSRE